jgi:hypothetical protein
MGRLAQNLEMQRIRVIDQKRLPLRLTDRRSRRHEMIDPLPRSQKIARLQRHRTIGPR